MSGPVSWPSQAPMTWTYSGFDSYVSTDFSFFPRVVQVGSPMATAIACIRSMVGMESTWSSACSFLDCSDLHSRARTLRPTPQKSSGALQCCPDRPGRANGTYRPVKLGEQGPQVRLPDWIRIMTVLGAKGTSKRKAPERPLFKFAQSRLCFIETPTTSYQGLPGHHA